MIKKPIPYVRVTVEHKGKVGKVEFNEKGVSNIEEEKLSNLEKVILILTGFMMAMLTMITLTMLG